ncbi:MAG: hypothetical protein CL878_05450 [Dehalococcoidia bacterium]|nr:hypothetical protein [Dehalococcoidia bacterium]
MQHHAGQRTARPLAPVRPATRRRALPAMGPQGQAEPVVATLETVLRNQLVEEVRGREIEYTWVTPECPSDPMFNDFFTVDIVDPVSGASLFNALYVDTFAPNLGPALSPHEQGNITMGFCAPPGPLEVDPPGTPKIMSVSIPPSLSGQVVELQFHCGNGFDQGFGSWAYVDNVTISGGTIPPTIPLQFQVNQPDATLDIDGLAGGPFTPTLVLRWENEPAPASLNLISDQVGMPWDLGVGTLPPAPLSTNGLITPGDQIVNLQFSDPQMSFLNDLGFNNSFLPCISCPILSPPSDISGQMLVISPAQVDGFALSQATGLLVREPQGLEFQAEIPDLTQLSTHLIDITDGPTPNTFNAPELSAMPMGSVLNGEMTIDVVDPVSGTPFFTETQPVELDLLGGFTLTAGGSVASNLGAVFPTIATFGPVPGNLTVTWDASVTMSIGGLFLFPFGRTYITDKNRIVPHIVDGYPNFPDLTQMESNNIVTNNLGLGAVIPNKVGSPADSYDCHGFTFTGGDHWINDWEVDEILADNGYVLRTAPNITAGSWSWPFLPVPPTIVVYRNPARVSAANPLGVTHSGIVTMVNAAGMATQVESKWGRLGRYRHSPTQVPPSYGTPSYYNTMRGSNRLRHRP